MKTAHNKSTSPDSRIGSRRGWITVLQFLVGVGLMAILLRVVNFHQVLETIEGCRPGWLFLACANYFFAQYVVALILAWLSRVYAKVPAFPLWGYNLIGYFFSNFIPSGIGGDVIKGFYLARFFPRRSQAFAVMIVQRFLGFLGTIVVGLCAATFILPRPQMLVWLQVALLLLAVGLVFGIAGWRWFIRQPHISAEHSHRPLLRLIYRLLEGLAVYRHHWGLLFGAFLPSCGTTLIGVLTFALIARSLNANISFAHMTLAGSLTQICAVIPLTPGALGISDASFVGICVLLGNNPGEAMAVMLLMRLLHIIVSLAGGVIYLFSPLRAQGGGLQNSHHEAQ